MTKLNPLVLILFSICYIITLGYVDYTTGPNISFSCFYILPVALFTWFLPIRWVIFPLILIIISRIFSEVITPYKYMHPIFPYWNIFWEVAAFFLITFFLFKLKMKMELISLQNERLEENIKLIQEQTNQLLESQIELERSKRLSDIGVLAATVAHELRNPLARIGLATHNIRNAVQGSDIEKRLVTIDKSLADSEQIINNLLYYSRLKPPHYERVNIFDIIEECTDGLEKRNRKNITVIKESESINDLLIEADPIQIKEVFNNILNNACDAVSSENGQIKIIADNEDEFVKVVIEDNGSGIAQDILKRIFEPFFTTKAKGTGLGLSVCQQIIKGHGGKIEIKSEPGQGASFIVRLPKVRITNENKITK